jgi:hypothetical protein
MAILVDLIDRFNAMLQSVVAMPQFRHVHFVDLRRTLSTGANYRAWWDNELHPTKRGFRAVTVKFAQKLAGL